MANKFGPDISQNKNHAVEVDVIACSQKTGALPAESKDEQAQFIVLGKAIISDGLSHEHLIKECLETKKKFNMARRNVRRAKYEHLCAIYKILCAAFANHEIMKKIKLQAECINIVTASTTSTALLFVKFLS